METKQRFKSGRLFATAAFFGGAVGAAPKAAEALCECTPDDILPISVTRTGSPADWFYAATSQFRAYISADSTYGFTCDQQAQAMRVDYVAPGGLVNRQVCRTNYSNSVIECGTVSTSSAAAETIVHSGSLDATGLNGSDVSDLDKFYFNVSGGLFDQNDLWRLLGLSGRLYRCW